MTTPSEIAKVAAGTFIQDSLGKAKDSPVFAWVQKECREGSLHSAISSFSSAQPEFLDPSLVLVEAIGPDRLDCMIPVRQFDHESTGTFLAEVRFTMNPTTGQAVRVLHA